MAVRLITISSSSTVNTTGPDVPNNVDGFIRMNGNPSLSGLDISGYDRSKVLNKIRDKRASFPFIEKAFNDREREEKSLNSLATGKPASLKNINIRNSLIKGEQLLSFRTSGTSNSINTASESDEVMSMETFLSSSISCVASHVPAMSTSTKSALPHGIPNFNNLCTNNLLQRKPVVMTTAGMKQNPGYGYNGISNGLTVKQFGSGFSNKEEPKYGDPLSGATASFQQRLMELAALEAETIRWERTKKVKKKNKDRDS
ncbi:hypothetical protein Btru_069470 [Bulinus truncatus]|nr:hypothetical protein Btru_069470 [Bulinus truncatus]